jgi:hypothetical protein
MSEKVNVEKLHQLAPKGLKQYEYARRVGITVANMPNALRRHGLYRVWQQARFKKCSMSGSASVTTASVEAISPSARSEARMVGGTNCGT